MTFEMRWQPPKDFSAYLASKDAGGAQSGFVEADLRLAFQALVGDPAAIAELEGNHFASMDPHLRKLGLGASEIEDVKQTLKTQMLVSDGESAPRLSQYEGRGALKAWLRVSAVREGLKRIKRDKHNASASDQDEEALLADGTSASDPELSYMKSLYRDTFRAAFRDAIGALGDRDRTLLKQSLIDGLSIDELSRLYGAHRATTARWLQSAKQKVSERTRENFIARSNANKDEIESIFRMISTHLDVSLKRHLG
jgi:RNA polymerase sigma-70 factor, ECF subfamily